MKKLLAKDFVRFGIVGGIGFVVNFIILTLLYKVLNSPILIAQLLAGEIALLCNFLLHNKWTYNSHNVQKSFRQLIIQFHVTSWIAVIGVAIIVTVGIDVFHLHYFVALMIAAATAMLWNFCWTKYVIWRAANPDHSS